MDGPLDIQADTIRWEAGVAAAEGGVVVQLGEETLVGARARWDGAVLVVEEGEYRRADGVLAFERAEVHPTEGTAVIVGTRVVSGGAEIEAQSLTVAEGKWDATEATVLPCSCTDGGRPAVTLRAARITVVPDRVVILHGGVVQVFSVPVLPVPWARMPLDPHTFRLLVPELGWGVDGPSARVWGRAGVGETFFEGGPAWNLERGPRAELSVTAPPGGVRGAVGYDLETATFRGAVASRAGYDAAVRVAWDAAWVSDADYLADYAVDYVSRGVGWRESRAVLGLGPGLVDVWLPDDGSRGALARGRAEVALGRGPSVVTPRVIVAAEGDLAGGVEPVIEAGIGGRSAGGWPWLALEARADLAARASWDEGVDVVGANLGDLDGVGDFWDIGGRSWGDGLAAGPLARGGAWRGLGGTAAGSAAVPIWSTLFNGRAIQWWPGVRAEARAGWNGEGALAWRAGPSLRVATASAGDGIGLDVAVLQDGAGWRPTLAADVRLAAFELQAQADPDIQLGGIRWKPGAIEVGGGTAHTSGLWLAWGDTSLAAGRLRTGGGVSWDLLDARFAGANARVGYDDGCVAASLNAHFGPDRPMPELGVAATVRR